jgi:transcriptional regulator with XRE-family HTH domain
LSQHVQLKKLRERKGLGQTEFAKMVGLGQVFLSRIELGKAKLPSKYVEKICEILGVTRDDLFAEPLIEFNKEYMNIAFDIVDPINSKDFDREIRVSLLETAYKLVKEFLDKNLTVEQFENELIKFRVDVEIKENFLEKMEQILTTRKNGR